MIDDIVWVNQFNVNLIKSMTTDIPVDLWRAQPPGLVNHAAWQVGHVTNARANLAVLLGRPAPVAHSELKTRFGTGSIPEPHSLGGADKEAILESFWAAQEHIAELLAGATETLMNTPTPVEQYRFRFPSIRDMTRLVLTVHDSFHIGQLSAWRSALGLPRVIG